jgi:hypothetical protein
MRQIFRVNEILGIFLFENWDKLFHQILFISFPVPFFLFYQLVGASTKIIAFCNPDMPYFNSFGFEVQGFNETSVCN